MLINNKRKVFVIGLDCASPKLIFEDFRNELPNLRMLYENGVYALMKSIYPPITIPAWMSMCSGLDAGEMGVYGFRTRKDNSYTEFNISTSLEFLKIEKIWDVLARYGKKSILVGVPPSYPVYPVNGCMVADFICPDSKSKYTYPESLKQEIEDLVGEYIFDVPFRIDDRDMIKKNAWDMTEKRFKVINYLIENKDWDFFMFVEIGVDRIHHAFWKYFDKNHHLYQENNPYEQVILDYYKLVDEKIGEILSVLDDNTDIFVVSDHGVKPMKGAFCLNEWFIKNGYLVLNDYPEKPVSFGKLNVNWDKTKAWGWGGYYGRIFINKKGREKRGIVDESEYEKLREEIIYKLENEKDMFGNKWNTKVYKPEKLYKKLNGDSPDLMAYFDDLYYRSAGTVGHNKLFLTENDTGPDDAMHDWYGIFIHNGPSNIKQESLKNLKLTDFKKMVLSIFGN